MKTFDPTDKERLEAHRQLIEDREADTRWLMRSPAGRRIVWELLTYSGVMAGSYNPHSVNPAADLAYAEGRRDVGRLLLNRVMRLCPKQYLLMQKENEVDRQSRRPAGD